MTRFTALLRRPFKRTAATPPPRDRADCPLCCMAACEPCIYPACVENLCLSRYSYMDATRTCIKPRGHEGLHWWAGSDGSVEWLYYMGRRS